MPIDEVLNLVRCFLQSELESPAGALSNRLDVIIASSGLRRFLVAFTNPSDPSAQSRCIYPGTFVLLVMEYHLVHFAPVESAARSMPRPQQDQQSAGLALERQQVKVNVKVGGKGHQLFEERMLSLSLLIYQHGTFRLVALGDKGAKVRVDKGSAFEGDEENRIPYIDPHTLGKAAGLSHFLITLAWMIETWQNGWSRTLNAIDEIVGFNVSSMFTDYPSTDAVFFFFSEGS
jgi:hypothetical protein